MNEKFVMPWEERPADCKEVALFEESCYRTLSDTFIE